MTVNGEFKGSTKQAIADMNSRLNRIEDKLDRVIERNIVIAAVVSGVTGLVVAVIGTFTNRG